MTLKLRSATSGSAVHAVACRPAPTRKTTAPGTASHGRLVWERMPPSRPNNPAHESTLPKTQSGAAPVRRTMESAQFEGGRANPADSASRFSSVRAGCREGSIASARRKATEASARFPEAERARPRW